MKKLHYFCFGVDIGGTNTKISLFEINSSSKKLNSDFYIDYKSHFFDIKLIDSVIIKTQKNFRDENTINSSKDFINNLYNSFDNLISKNKIEKNQLFAYSFATPGFPDNNLKKVIGGAFNIHFLDKIEFSDFVSNYDNNYFYLNLVNDVTSQGYYEQVIKQDKFKNKDDIAVLIALGTGIGGAIFTKEKILLGQNGWAAEFGHLPLWFKKSDDKITKCTCGKINCIEAFASVRAYIDMLKEKGFNISAEQSLEKYFSGKAEQSLIDVTNFWLETLATLTSTLIYIFNPSIIIIGGSVSKIEKFTNLIYTRTKEYVNPILMEDVKFFTSSDAILAGTYGAVIHGITTMYDKIINRLK